MTRYNCGGPDNPGGTHWSCDCESERLLRSGAAAERRAVIAHLEGYAVGRDALLDLMIDRIVGRIEACEHLSGAELDAAVREAGGDPEKLDRDMLELVRKLRGESEGG